MTTVGLRLRVVVAIAVAAFGGGCGPSTSPTPTSTRTFGTSPTPSVEASPTPSSTSDPEATPAPSMIAASTLDEAGATRLTVTADWLAVAEGSAWAAAGSGVERFDGRDGSVVTSVPVPDGICLGFDVAFGAVWAGASPAGAPSLVRIDAATGKVVATIPLKIAAIQCESSVGAGEGAIWLISTPPDRVLLKVDPATNEVEATFPMPPEDPDGLRPANTDFGGLRAGYGGVWIADQGHDAVLRLSPADGSIVARVPLGSGSGPRFLAIGEGAVWVLNQTDGTVARIDPTKNSVVATVHASATSVDGGDIAVGCGAVWARVSDELVAQIDPATNEVVARYGPPAGSGSVACGDGVLWLSAHDVNAIWRMPLR